MHIYYDFQVFVWQRYGGISRLFFELIKHLPDVSQLEVTLFAGLNVSQLELHSLSSERVKVLSVPNRIGLSKHLVRRLNRLMFTCYMRERKGIYHPTYYSTNLRKMPNIKTVLTVHDMTHELFPHLFSHRDSTCRTKKKAIHNADAIICVSKNTRKDLLRMFSIPSNKVHVVYHGVSLAGAGPTPTAANPPFILYVGERKGYKNFNCLLHAYGNSRWLKKHFNLLCCGGPAFDASEKKLIAGFGVEGKVTHLFPSDPQLKSLYSAASAFVYPSLYEGFGLPLLEAMACGTPVLCSNVASMPEVVGNAGRFFDPRSHEDLSVELERLLSSETDRQKLIKFGRERSHLFTWERCAAETCKVYESLA